MKKIILSLLIFTSCNQNSVEPIVSVESTEVDYLEIDEEPEELIKVKFRGINAMLPANYPLEILEYEGIDLLTISLLPPNSNGIKINGSTGKTILEITKSVRGKYKLSDEYNLENFKRYFPLLKLEELKQNESIIVDYINKLMGFEIATLLSQLEDKDFSENMHSKKGRILKTDCDTSINPELSYYLAHSFWMNWAGLLAAKNASFDLQQYRFPGSDGSGKADAYRHGVWACLTAKNGFYPYCGKSRRIELTRGFCASHEVNSCNSDLADAIDLHNNERSLHFYDLYSYYSASGLSSAVDNWAAFSGAILNSPITDISQIANFPNNLLWEQ